jgi:hypothetical protein
MAARGINTPTLEIIMNKCFLILLSLLFFSTNSFAGPGGHADGGGGTTFVVSSEAIKAVLESPLVWRRLGGAVQQVTMKQPSPGTYQFQISTQEWLEQKNAEGVVVDGALSPCHVTTSVSQDNAGNYIVAQPDFSACPGAIPVWSGQPQNQ